MFINYITHKSNNMGYFATMRKYVFLFFITVLFVSSTNAQKNVYFDKLENINDVYYLNGKPFTGRSLVVYDTLKTKKIEIYWKDGLMDGTKTTFYKKSKVKQIMNFEKGKRQGEYVNYYENGKVKERGFYKDDFLVGTMESFYPNGRTRFVYNYNNGYQRGWNILYFENGQKEQEAFINEKGWIDSTFRAWYPSGYPMKEIDYDNGIYNGIYKEWHSDGTLAYEGNYTNGLKDGTHKTYEVLVGVLLKKESYKLGKKDGTWITYGLEGDTAKIMNYVNDTLDGEFAQYINGRVESKGEYVMGVKDGFWQQNLVTLIGGQEGTYNMGVKVGEWILYDFKGKWLATITLDDNGEVIDEYWYGMKKRKKKKK